ncbi:MAG: SGNH/GDSL hydrolase family protein [Lentisphaerae bacterium]|nr:SGNH/GDSL hydrolase family protein [Lentisphaerota bacterium]
MAVYPKELFDLFKKGGNPVVKFIGTHSGVGNPEREGFPMIEGYGGWTWEGFCTRCAEKPLNDPAAYRRGSSPFVFLKNGNPIIDFKMYCDKKNEGNAPDYITVFLGINDSFAADDTNIDTAINNILKYADILLTEFRKVGSNTKIGIVITPPPAGTQDAFGENSQCGQTRWQYRKNQHKLVERYLQYFSGREKENIFIIPVYVNIDCVNNYPKREERINARNPKMIFRDINAVHPAKEGNFQIADSFYSWFKYELNKK